MAAGLESLPTWALDTMSACLRDIESPFADEVEAARKARLFEEAEAWYAKFPEWQRVKYRELTPPNTWKPVRGEDLDAIFGAGGELAKVFDRYEPRAGQQAMAHAVAEALKFADANGETLVVVTADHETGGLVLLDGDEQSGRILGIYTSDDHTPAMLPVFAYGPGADRFCGTYLNTEIARRIRELTR